MTAWQRTIRRITQAQFRYPYLRRPINATAQIAVRFLGTRILSGAGKGLRINAIGANPGFLFGTSEPLEQSIIAQLLRPGDVFYNLGANIGFYCLLGAKSVGTNGQVYAFEPTSGLVERIRENASLNGFSQIEVVPAAVCERTGMIDFCLEGDLSVQNSIRETNTSNTSVKVPCTTIDDFASNHKPPNLMLIDIEGAEISALQGALKTISQYRPTMMIEVHWLGEAFTEFVAEHLEPMGYLATTFDGLPMPTDCSRYHCLLKVTN